MKLEGVPILFDDSFVHSAVHQVVEDDDENTALNSDAVAFDGSRIVLIVDFWHPALSEMDRNALVYCIHGLDGLKTILMRVMKKHISLVL